MIGNEPNADEVKAHRMKMLGPELGLVYNALYNKCVLLHVKWRQYLELFGYKPEGLIFLVGVPLAFSESFKILSWMTHFYI